MKFKNFSFGATSAVITSLAVLVGLSKTVNAVVNIVSALLIIAIADNVSDSFGIHVHQESQDEPPQEVRKATFLNFITRLVIVLIFILFVILLPMNLAVIFSIIFGLSIIIILSYFIARQQKINPYVAIFRHLLLTVAVMVASYFLREISSNIIAKFKK